MFRNSRTTYLVLALAVASVLFAVPTRAHAYYCSDPTYGSPINCNKDDKTGRADPSYPTCDSMGGFCQNRVCQCGVTDPGVCPAPGGFSGNACPLSQYCNFSGSGYCGGHQVFVSGGTVHVTDCRCIAGYAGGCISYCNNTPPACVPAAGSPCLSAPNICGMRGSGTVSVVCVCSATVPSDALCGALPVGTFATADCTKATGTASDADTVNPINVQIFVDGVLNSTVTANAPQPNWQWFVPGALKNGVAHTIRAYAVNAPSGANPELLPSHTITCDDPPTASLSAATCSSATINASDSSGLPVPVQLVDGTLGSGGRILATTTVSGSKAVSWAPGITDGGIHTLHLYAQNVPSGGPYVDMATAAVSCPLDTPVITAASVTGDYCTSGSQVPTISVSWTTVANPQVQYRIIADDGILFALPWRYDSGLVISSSKTGTIPQGKLTFGATYYVKVQAIGTSGIPSAFSNPSAPIVVPVAPIPTIKMSVTPAKPIAKQEATFSDDTDYMGDTILTRTWDFGDGTIITENAPITGNTVKHTYLTQASVTATLTVRTAAMPVGKTCSATLSLGVSKAIPIFIEVRP